MKAFLEWLGGIFTDALGRPEVKMMLGVPLFIGAQVYVITIGAPGLGVYSVITGTALTLMGITAYGDAQIDKGGA
jgi:hypothetical protein